MASIKKSGGWKSSIGGTDYKSKGGKICIQGTEKGKGTPGALPSGGGEKKGQFNVLGEGHGRGIPKKSSGGGTSSKWAAAHD